MKVMRIYIEETNPWRGNARKGITTMYTLEKPNLGNDFRNIEGQRELRFLGREKEICVL